MEVIANVFQVVIFLGILNVWFLRSEKATQWRGKNAKSLKEEFEAYGLPFWFMCMVGGLKVLSAVCLVAGIGFPVLTVPAASMMSLLMLGAVTMHFKVEDPLMRALPAATMLAMSLFVLIVNWY